MSDAEYAARAARISHLIEAQTLIDAAAGLLERAARAVDTALPGDAVVERVIDARREVRVAGERVRIVRERTPWP